MSPRRSDLAGPLVCDQTLAIRGIPYVLRSLSKVEMNSHVVSIGRTEPSHVRGSPGMERCRCLMALLINFRLLRDGQFIMVCRYFLFSCPLRVRSACNRVLEALQRP